MTTNPPARTTTRRASGGRHDDWTHGSADAIDRASVSFWLPAELDRQVQGAEPLTADESFAIPDLTDDEWDAFARALHE